MFSFCRPSLCILFCPGFSTFQCVVYFVHNASLLTLCVATDNLGLFVFSEEFIAVIMAIVTQFKDLKVELIDHKNRVHKFLKQTDKISTPILKLFLLSIRMYATLDLPFDLQLRLCAVVLQYNNLNSNLFRR